MAIAKKCDRCGEYYQERERTAMDDIADAFAKFNTPKTALASISVIERFLDLCPNCSQSLKRWVKREGEEDG